MGSHGIRWASLVAPACAASGGEAAHLLQSTMHNRWNVFTGAEPYAVWRLLLHAPWTHVVDRRPMARHRHGGMEVLRRAARQPWRQVALVAVPRSVRRADDAFWRALCDEWESRDAAGRRVVSFVFYLLQADVVPAGRESVLRADEAWQGYLPEYGAVRKRRIRQFSCLQSSSNGSG